MNDTRAFPSPFVVILVDSFIRYCIVCMYVDFHPPGSKGMSSPLTMDVVDILRCLAKFDADFLSLHLGHIVHFCLYTRG